MPMTASQPRLYYRRRGAGEPLLAILGFATSSAILDSLAERYTERFDCVTYDNPGTGRSSKATFPHTTAALAAAAVRLMDELEIESAHIAGISLGGAIAQELALRFPHRVRGLILVATSPAGPLSTPPGVRAVATAACSRALGPLFFTPQFMRGEPAAAAKLMRSVAIHPAAPWSVFGQLLAAGLHDRTLDLHRIRAPTLVLAGDDDFLVPIDNARLLAERIPDAELRILHGRHGFSLERPEETFAAITEWLDRRRPQTAAAPPTAGAATRERITREIAAPLGALRLYRSVAVLASRAVRR